MTQAALTIPEACSDNELSARIANRDKHAFAILMRRYNRLLYRTARGILGNDHEAEDCVQEAYLSAYRSMPNFRAQARLSTWLVRIVINQALEKLRKRKSEGGNVSLDNVVELDSRLDNESALVNRPEPPEGAAMRAELRSVLESKIDRLPAAFRTVFILRALEEMSVEETAACLGIAQATVRTRFFRARSLLREAIARDIDLAVEDAFGFEGARCDRIVAAVLERIDAASASDSHLSG
jgi:RNA polymerase sigma-70 factor, ECF subfamily